MTIRISVWCWRSLFLTGLFGLLLVSFPAAAQTPDGSSGPRFIQAGDRGEQIQQVPPPPECHTISHNIRFCPAGTDWVLEGERIPDAQALYRLTEDKRAAFTIIFMEENVSQTLSNDAVEALMMQHVFDQGPRGRMTIETVLTEMRSSFDDRLIQQTAIVRDPQGMRQLLTVTTGRDEYGLSFTQSTLALADTIEPSDITDAQLSLHDEVLALTFILFGADLFR